MRAVYSSSIANGTVYLFRCWSSRDLFYARLNSNEYVMSLLFVKFFAFSWMECYTTRKWIFHDISIYKVALHININPNVALPYKICRKKYLPHQICASIAPPIFESNYINNSNSKDNKHEIGLNIECSEFI